MQAALNEYGGEVFQSKKLGSAVLSDTAAIQVVNGKAYMAPIDKSSWRDITKNFLKNANLT